MNISQKSKYPYGYGRNDDEVDQKVQLTQENISNLRSTELETENCFLVIESFSLSDVKFVGPIFEFCIQQTKKIKHKKRQVMSRLKPSRKWFKRKKQSFTIIIIRSLEGIQALSGLRSVPLQIPQPVLAPVAVEKIAKSMIGPTTFVLGQHQRYMKDRICLELHRQQFSKNLPTILAISKQNGLDLSISKQQIAELSDREWADLFLVANGVVKSNNGKLTLSHAFTMSQQIRGGDLDIWRYGGIFAGILAYLMNINAFTPQSGPVREPSNKVYIGIDGAHYRKSDGSSDRRSTKMVVKPEYMEQKEFSQLTPAKKRAIAHPYDEFAILPNGVIVRIGFHQVHDEKAPSHGPALGLPFTVSKSGATKTPKSARNGLAGVSVLAEIARSSEIDNPNAAAQLVEGTYQMPQGPYANPQASQDRGFEAYLVYEPKLGRISVYNKKTNDFVTVCLMDDKEIKEFKETKNFGGGAGWFSSKPKNVAPSDSLVSQIQKDSPVDFKAIDERLSQGVDTSKPIIVRNNEPEL